MRTLSILSNFSFQRTRLSRCSSLRKNASSSTSSVAHLQLNRPTTAPSSTTSQAPKISCPESPFEALQLHPPIINALRSAFPSIKSPTRTQAKFISAILSGKDVLLKDVTGSGKSFGLILALMNKPRFIPNGQTDPSKQITSLVLVPHRDLAYQLYHWIERIVSASSTDVMPSMASLAQVLVRNAGKHVSEGLSILRMTPPHILIGTPQAVMDVYKQDAEALQISYLSTVAVDEVDYLIKTVPRKDPTKSFHKATAKAFKKLKAHPGVTRELLDLIFRERKASDGDPKPPGSGVGSLDGKQYHKSAPQLIMSSATLRRHLNNYLFEESGWLNRGAVVKVNGTGTGSPARADQDAPTKAVHSGLGGRGISHSVLLISEGNIRNIEGAVDQPHENDENTQVIDAKAVFGEPESDPSVKRVEMASQRLFDSESTYNANAMETIATAFALDVPSIALLVLPSSSSVERAVYELRELGVNALGLDLTRNQQEQGCSAASSEDDPILLVSTLATTRGMDLPELQHVFILGVPEGPRVTGRTVDAYVHIAGRAGRFGRGGKVVTVVEEVAGEGAKMLRILKTVGVVPVRFPHFQ